jgi:galactokinase
LIRLGYDGPIDDGKRLAEAIERAGFSSAVAARKASLVIRAFDALEPSPKTCPIVFLVPGRIEILGKHTDYCGGRTMVAAAERGFAIVAEPNEDDSVELLATDIEPVHRVARFRFDPELAIPTDGHWATYPMTVARRVARNFPGQLRGMRLAIASDLPMAAGMSSSSVLVVGIFLAISAINQLEDRPEYREAIRGEADLAGYLGTVENGQSFGPLVGDRGVGTFGGSEDHTAILCCQPGMISQFSYCPVRFERTIPIPDGWTLAVGVSGVVAEKTKAAREKYNAISLRATTLLEIWRGATGRLDPNLGAVLQVDPGAAELLEGMIGMVELDGFGPEELIDRLCQFVTESNQIIPAAGDALLAADWEKFAEQVGRSQEMAENQLDNQVDQTAFLAQTAGEFGASGASSFGAGFGGSVWAMIEEGKAEDFLERWQARYGEQFPEEKARATFFTTGAGPAAVRLD